MVIRPLHSHEIKKKLHCHNPIKLSSITMHYAALEITITNKSSTPLIIDKNTIGLPIQNTLRFQKKMSTTPLIIPLLTTLASTALLITGIGFATIPSIIAGTTLGITALNVGTTQKNTIHLKKIEQHLLDDVHPTEIAQFQQCKKILFIPRKKLKKEFIVSWYHPYPTIKKSITVKL
ncbi:MAG: hypothetical protein US69_C0006G0033 [candidate division TM6 bacterium GW2011_GWF2_38_10]|nr:MAG: hypothetical protein US69_C0006G0033 [candidate division TM6 bacterium GW2011_GWF2_38_10]